MDDLVLLEKIDGIAIVRLNRPDKGNAISHRLLLNLNEILAQIEQDLSLRVVIITGNSQKYFCSGADLKERLELDEDDTFEMVKNIQATFDKIADLEIPTIASINGIAFGGGLELALACDMRIASENAVMGLTECSLGIIPGAGGTQRLPKLIGISKSLELILSAKRINAQEAYDIGLVNLLAESSDDSLDKAKKISEKILDNAPLAVKAAKKAILGLYSDDIKMGLKHELNCYKEILNTKDRLLGLKAFKKKVKPEFIGK